VPNRHAKVVQVVLAKFDLDHLTIAQTDDRLRRYDVRKVNFDRFSDFELVAVGDPERQTYLVLGLSRAATYRTDLHDRRLHGSSSMGLAR